MSGAVVFNIFPNDLADVLHNAVEISKEGRGVENVPHIMLSYQPHAGRGMVVGAGIGRYAGGRSVTFLDGLPCEDAGSVCIERDVAAALQSAVRKVKGGKGARVQVSIYPEPVTVQVKNEHGLMEPTQVNLLVQSAEDTLADLLDADPSGVWDAAFDFLDDMLADPPGPLQTPVALTVDVLSRLGKIRSDGPVLDIRRSKHERIVAAAIGRNFRGIIGDVDRANYAAGGPWGDGPGVPEHLF